MHSATQAQGFGWLKMAPFSLTPGYTRVTNPMLSSSVTKDGAFSIRPQGVYSHSSTASMQESPCSRVAVPLTTAQVLLSICTLPSRASRDPMARPSAVKPRRNHSPSHSSFRQVSSMASFSFAYFSVSSARPSARAASRKWFVAQTSRKATIALSPPPRFRQSFQSARRPFVTPWTPVCA